MPFLKLQTPKPFTVDKTLLIEKLITQAVPSSYSIIQIPGDASKRVYCRINTLEKSYILMDASEDNQSHIPFVKVASFLQAHNFKVPEIIAQDLDNGLLLLEDFGSKSLKGYLIEQPTMEESCYNLAVDLLVKLNSIEPPDNFPRYTQPQFLKEIEVFTGWYLSRQLKSTQYQAARDELLEVFAKYFADIVTLKPVVMLWDFMSENILWRENLDDLQKLGLIDFQDAKIGYPFYDLASLLEDARREVSETIIEACLKRYVSKTNEMPLAEAKKFYNLIAAQKNMRIIGVFYRLNYRDGKGRYLSYVPRMMRYLRSNLESGFLPELKQWFVKYDIYPNEHDYQ